MTYEVHRSAQSSGPLSLVLNGARDLRDALVGGAMAAREAAAEMLGRPAHTLAVIGGIVGGVAAMPKSADAAAIVNLSREPQHNVLGDRPGTFWVEATIQFEGQPFNYSFTSFPVGKVKDAQGNTIKTYLYLPPHDYAEFSTPGPGDSTILAIGTGTNRLTNRGTLLENLREEYRSPLYNLNAPNMNAGDIGIWSTTTDIPDAWIPELAPIGSAAQGNIAFVAGFDRLSTPSTGLLPDTGDSYGYFAEIRNAVPQNIQSGTHKSLDFDTNNALNFNGASETQGSGSWVLDSQDRLWGAAVAVTGSPTSTFRRTIFADFTDSGYRDQLLPYSGIQVVPEPAGLAAVAVGAGIMLGRRRRDA